MHNIIGTQVRDKITGFFGTVTGRVEYLTGCNQLLVTPLVRADGSIVDAQWFDEQRCEPAGSDRIVLDNGENPGFDRAPPIR